MDETLDGLMTLIDFDHWQRWDRGGLVIRHPRSIGGDRFGAELLELGYRVCEILWDLFDDECVSG